MMANPHALVEGVVIASYAIRANHAFIYVRGEVLHVVRRLQAAVQEAYEAGYLGTDILGSGYDLESSCTPAPAPTSAARRPRCWTRWRATAASRGSGRRSRPSRGSTPARPSSTTSSRSRACPPSSPTAPTGSPRWAPRSPGLRALLAVRPRHPARPVRGAARHHAARAARPGGRDPRGPPAEVLDARAAPRRRCSPPSTSTCRWTSRASARPARCSAPGRCRSSTRRPAWCAPCCAGPSSTRTSPAASARRAARAPTGWCRCSSGWRRARATRRT